MAGIILGEDFAVSVGEPGLTYTWSIGDPDPYSYSGDAVLAGRIERRGTKFFGHLLGVSHTTVNNFRGDMEVDQPVRSQGGGFSGSVWSVLFVLSTNASASPFLLEGQAGK